MPPLSMPTTVTQHRKRSILPFLQGLLPDSDEALRPIARRYQVSSENPFALLEHTGADTAGAVQIVPQRVAASDAVASRQRVRPVTESEVAILLTQVVAEYTEGAPIDAIGRFSLAGAQPKFACIGYRMVAGASYTSPGHRSVGIVRELPAATDRFG